jgi:hypothetical protein
MPENENPQLKTPDDIVFPADMSFSHRPWNFFSLRQVPENASNRGPQ